MVSATMALARLCPRPQHCIAGIQPGFQQAQLKLYNTVQFVSLKALAK